MGHPPPGNLNEDDKGRSDNAVNAPRPAKKPYFIYLGLGALAAAGNRLQREQLEMKG